MLFQRRGAATSFSDASSTKPCGQFGPLAIIPHWQWGDNTPLRIWILALLTVPAPLFVRALPTHLTPAAFYSMRLHNEAPPERRASPFTFSYLANCPNYSIAGWSRTTLLGTRIGEDILREQKYEHLTGIRLAFQTALHTPIHGRLNGGIKQEAENNRLHTEVIRRSGNPSCFQQVMRKVAHKRPTQSGSHIHFILKHRSSSQQTSSQTTFEYTHFV